MTGDCFAIRTRFKAVKAELRRSTHVGPETQGHEDTGLFLRDLVGEMARMHPSDGVVGRRNVLRCMAETFRSELTEILRPAPSSPPAATPRPDYSIWPKDRFPVKEADLRTGDWREKSALKLLGYTVGATHGWAPQDRQDFLRYFMEAQLPLRVAELFGNKYGRPLSDQRLSKVVSLLKFHIRNFSRKDPSLYGSAIDDWQDHLAFLRQVCGAGRPALALLWPERVAR